MLLTNKLTIKQGVKAMTKNIIILTGAEIQSGLDRVKAAEGLIQQLPKDHDGRNTWLLNYGIRGEATDLRSERGFVFHSDTMACETTGVVTASIEAELRASVYNAAPRMLRALLDLNQILLTQGSIPCGGVGHTLIKDIIEEATK